jgi:hypothetical protein
MIISRARDTREMPKGTWVPFGEMIIVKCPTCGTSFIVALDYEGEVHCPREGCPFFCQTTDLEGFEEVRDTTGDAARRGGGLK